MDDEKLKLLIGKNIAAYRRRAGLTQSGLAEKLNYSDKAVSKWERAESIPDVITLVNLSRLFEITVEDLLRDPEALPEDPGNLERVMSKVSEKALKRKANKGIILALSSVLCWFVALLFFVVVSSLGVPHCWLPFFYAVPANAIVLLSLRSAWRDFRWNRTLISVIMWGSLVSIHITMLTLLDFNMWKLYLLGIPGQIAILLWFRLYRNARSRSTEME